MKLFIEAAKIGAPLGRKPPGHSILGDGDAAAAG